MKLMKQIWKDIKGYEGLYKINVSGEIVSLPHKYSNRWGSTVYTPARKLKPTYRPVDGGYYVYGLTDAKHKIKQHRMNILVAETFNREIKFNNLPGETWRFSFANYEVSNLGRVRSNIRNYQKDTMTYSEYRLISFQNNGHGYLALNYKSKPIYLHRLVASAFIPNPNNLPQVNHKDGDKKNNRVSNLEWVTAEENKQHAKRMGLVIQGSKSWNTQITPEKARQIKLDFINGIPTTKIMNKYEADRHTVLSIAKGKSFKRETSDIPNYSGNAKDRANITRCKSKRNTSGHVGVNFDKKSGKWRSRICYKGKTIIDKKFSSMQKAVAYREKVLNAISVSS